MARGHVTPRSANVDGEILIVTKNSKTFNEQTSIGNVCTWFLATYFHAKPFVGSTEDPEGNTNRRHK